MSGIPDATPIVLTEAERAELDGLVRSTKTEYRLRQRARIVLLAADGMATRAVARAVGCTTGTASKWRVRYAGKRLAGLDESGDRGADPKYTAETGRRILAVLDGPPPPGHARWTAPLIARALGDVHEQYVWRFLRAQKIDLAGRKSWCVSNDPEFAAKAAEIVGLYLDPPDGALVIAVDEKPHIQALERAQGYLRLPNGRALGGQAHHYKRHGTSTLFAALNLANGEITARHYKRRRRIEFLDFMNRIVEAPTPLRGSTRSNAGSRSSPHSRSEVQASPALPSSGSTSMPSSAATTKPPAPSPGPNPRFIKSASNHVSRTCDSGY